MGSFLQLIGSIASIAGVPLTVYFFLRQLEAKHYRVRQEICRTLSYQLGEGRVLSQFEVRSVIGSKCREHRAKAHRTAQDEVIEALVTETISNPMLDSVRKQEILQNLQSLHSYVMALEVLTRHDITPAGILQLAAQHVDLTPEERGILDREDTRLTASELHHEGVLDTFSTRFGVVIVGLMSVLAALIVLSERVRYFVSDILATNGLLPTMSSGLLLGMLSSIIATIAVGMASLLASLLLRKLESDKQGKTKKKQDDQTNK